MDKLEEPKVRAKWAALHIAGAKFRSVAEDDPSYDHLRSAVLTAEEEFRKVYPGERRPPRPWVYFVDAAPTRDQA